MKTAVIITLFAVLFTACGPIGAQSRKATDQFEVTEFTAIESSVIGNIRIQQSPTISVTAEGNEALLDILNVRMDNGKRILEMEERYLKKYKKRSNKLFISISTPALT